MKGIKTIFVLREASELEDFQWQDVTQLIQDAFCQLQLRIYTRIEPDVYAMTTREDNGYALDDTTIFPAVSSQTQRTGN